MSRSVQTPRRGFTLPEMLIALVLFSLVGGGIITLVMRQQRFYRSTAEVIKVQGQLRQGGSGLPLDLRGISTSDTTANGITSFARAVNYNTDVYSRTEASIDFRRVFGSSVICAKPAVNVITIYPTALDAVPILTTWANQPQVGDSVLVLDEGKMLSTVDDRWRVYEVRTVAVAKGNKGCPWKSAVPLDSAPLLYAADTVRNSYRIGLGENHHQYVHVGAPVRFFRRVRYQSYQAADGEWYLGYADCLKTYATASLCSDPTPMSGPYQAGNGIVFSYFDSAGTALTSADASRRIARVDVVLRAASATAISRTGSAAPSTYTDSLLISIGIRNHR